MDYRASDADRARPAAAPSDRLWLSAIALAVFAAVMWFAWLGWDHEYYLVDGVAQGPYRARQVIGCGLTIAAATVATFLRAPRTAAIFVLATAASLGVAAPWSVDASSDESGLWVVGLFMLVIGGTMALAVLLAVTQAVTSVIRSAR